MKIVIYQRQGAMLLTSIEGVEKGKQVRKEFSLSEFAATIPQTDLSSFS